MGFGQPGGEHGCSMHHALAAQAVREGAPVVARVVDGLGVTWWGRGLLEALE